MSHHLDFIGLGEKLYLLRHLVIGCREYCKRERLYQKTWRDETDPENEWSNYRGRLKYLVSNDLIEIAAKFRVIQDACSADSIGLTGRELDDFAQEKVRIGTVKAGSFKLSLRESCNKIIHATEFSFLIADGRNAKPYFRYSYWNGRCVLKGSRGKEQWALELNVYDWCIAMQNYLDWLAETADIEW